MWYNVIIVIQYKGLIMAKSEAMSLRLSQETKQQLELLAEATGRKKTALAAEALDKYVKTEAWQIEAIQKGLKQAEDNKFVSHEDVKAKWLKKAKNNA